MSLPVPLLVAGFESVGLNETKHLLCLSVPQRYAVLNVTKVRVLTKLGERSNAVMEGEAHVVDISLARMVFDSVEEIADGDLSVLVVNEELRKSLGRGKKDTTMSSLRKSLLNETYLRNLNERFSFAIQPKNHKIHLELDVDAEVKDVKIDSNYRDGAVADMRKTLSRLFKLDAKQFFVLFRSDGGGGFKIRTPYYHVYQSQVAPILNLVRSSFLSDVYKLDVGATVNYFLPTNGKSPDKVYDWFENKPFRDYYPVCDHGPGECFPLLIGMLNCLIGNNAPRGETSNDSPLVETRPKRKSKNNRKPVGAPQQPTSVADDCSLLLDAQINRLIDLGYDVFNDRIKLQLARYHVSTKHNSQFSNVDEDALETANKLPVLPEIAAIRNLLCAIYSDENCPGFTLITITNDNSPVWYNTSLIEYITDYMENSSCAVLNCLVLVFPIKRSSNTNNRDYLVWNNGRWSVKQQDSIQVSSAMWLKEIKSKCSSSSLCSWSKDMWSMENTDNNNFPSTIVFTSDGYLWDVDTGNLFRAGPLDVVHPYSLNWSSFDIEKMNATYSDAYDWFCDKWRDVDGTKNDDTEEAVDFLYKIFLYDMELVKYFVILLAGVCFDKMDKLFVVCLGETGDNGKTVMCQVLKTMLGTYCYPIDERVISITKTPTSSDLIKCSQRWISLIDEISHDKLCTKTIKQVTGNTSSSLRELYQTTESVLFKTSLWVMGNNPPMANYDKALLRRLRVLNFKCTFVANGPTDPIEIKKSKTCARKKIMVEKVSRGLFMLMLAANRIHNFQRTVIPDTVGEHTDLMKKTFTTLNKFWKEQKFHFDKSLFVSEQEVRQACMNFNMTNSLISHEDLYDMFSKKFADHHNASEKVFEGITIRNEQRK